MSSPPISRKSKRKYEGVSDGDDNDGNNKNTGGATDRPRADKPDPSQFPVDVVKEVLLSNVAHASALGCAADWEQQASAVIAQREFLGTGHENDKGDWRHLLKRRVQDRIEAHALNGGSDRRKKDKSDGIVLPGPVDLGCKPKLDSSKYGFYIEAEGELSDHTKTRSFFVDSCEVATNDGDGDFVLFLNIPDFFDKESSSRPFDYYFEPGDRTNAPPYDTRAFSSYCEGHRHYPVRPCPVRIYVTHKPSGLQADLFATNFGRLWLYNTFDEYDDETEILPALIRMEMKKENDKAAFFRRGNNNSRILHIFNECEGLELHGEGRSFATTMGIALYRCGLDLRIRIKVEGFSNNGAGDFFGEKLQFR